MSGIHPCSGNSGDLITKAKANRQKIQYCVPDATERSASVWSENDSSPPSGTDSTASEIAAASISNEPARVKMTNFIVAATRFGPSPHAPTRK